MEYVCAFNVNFIFTSESRVVENIIYLVCVDESAIETYSLLGKFIKKIFLEVPNWQNTYAHILGEIIIIGNDQIIFYSLDGHELAITKINVLPRECRSGVTDDYVYMMNQLNVLHIYKRLL
jgi:hypothetical protein